MVLAAVLFVSCRKTMVLAGVLFCIMPYNYGFGSCSILYHAV